MPNRKKQSYLLGTLHLIDIENLVAKPVPGRIEMLLLRSCYHNQVGFSAND